MELIIGFITYNKSSSKYLPYFLPSLERALSFLRPEKYKVLVVNNSDKKDTSNQDYLNKSNLRSNLEIFNFGKNLGFGKAYNFLLSLAEKDQAKYFLIVNPDILLKKDSIQNMFEFLEENTEISAVSPKILKWDFENNKKTELIDTLGITLKSGLQFRDYYQNQTNEDAPQSPVSILGPSGAGGLYRLDKLKAVKINQEEYFDNSFFMYKEDCDLAYRMNIQNLKSKSLPTAIFYHDRSVAPKKNILQTRKSKSKTQRAWSFRNQHLLFIKHFKQENFLSKLKIIYYFITYFFFALLFEPFLLKEYREIIRRV